MGTIFAIPRLQILPEEEEPTSVIGVASHSKNLTIDLPDITLLPPELALHILSNFNATELCLAGCEIKSWSEITEDDVLWLNLVKSEWKYAAYVQERILEKSWQSFKKLYLLMDEAQLIFSINPLKGIEYLQDHGIVTSQPDDIALYLHSSKKLKKEELCSYLVNHRKDVLDEYIQLEDYRNQAVLPNVLRNFLQNFPARHCKLTQEDLALLLNKFSGRYVHCNPGTGLSNEVVYNICFSLMLLGTDLTHPLIKNKMSKREFIRNTRHLTPGVDQDYLAHAYDNVYLIGPVAR